MVKKSTQFNRSLKRLFTIHYSLFTSRGYTLIELLVVITIIGILATIAFSGAHSFNDAQAVANAQREFITNVRAAQNKVINGASGQSIVRVVLKDTTNGPSNNYLIGGMDGTNSQIIYLANGVTYTKSIPSAIDTNSASRIVICITHPAFMAFTSGMNADGCGWGGSSTTWGTCAGTDCSRGAVFRNSWWEWQSATPGWDGNFLVNIVFSKGNFSKTAVIEVSGMTFSRIYAQ